jgi:hypothetical protein
MSYPVPSHQRSLMDVCKDCGSEYRRALHKRGAPPTRCPKCRLAHLTTMAEKRKPQFSRCVWCKEEFQCSKGGPGTPALFCSTRCRSASWKKRTKPTGRTCLLCEQPFDVEPGPGAPPVYCRPCRAIRYGGRASKERRPPKRAPRRK